MKQYPLTQVGDPGFRTTCSAYSEHEILSPAVQTVIARMKYTMARVQGVGLAAPQIGLQKQLFVLRLKPTKYRPTIHKIGSYTVINPEIISVSEAKNVDWEGCFSVARAGLFAEVSRPHKITVRYLNDKAVTVERSLEGLEARVFQHEYDHLHGNVFLEIADTTTLMSAAAYKAMRQAQID